MEETVDLNELILQVFTDTVNNYFEEISGEKSETGLPYLKGKNQLVLEDVTGIIGISGNKKGFVYVTGKKDVFRELVKIILRNSIPNDSQIKDMAGEVANTVSGNARKAFGTEFLISVPSVIEGVPEDLEINKEIPTFVIPIKWRNHKANIVVGLE